VRGQNYLSTQWPISPAARELREPQRSLLRRKKRNWLLCPRANLKRSIICSSFRPNTTWMSSIWPRLLFLQISSSSLIALYAAGIAPFLVGLQIQRMFECKALGQVPESPKRREIETVNQLAAMLRRISQLKRVPLGEVDTDRACSRDDEFSQGIAPAPKGSFLGNPWAFRTVGQPC